MVTRYPCLDQKNVHVESETKQYKQGIQKNVTSEEQRRICAMQLQKTNKMPICLLSPSEELLHSF